MKRPLLPVLLVALIAAIVFIPFLGACPLFDWDEINFAECAREMIVSGDYSHVQINYRPFWEKPPFFIWMQAASMNVFGVNEFAARFPNALCSIATLCSLFVIGRSVHSARMGVVWAFLYASTLLPHLYFRSGLIDPWFNLFIFLSVYQVIGIFNDPLSKRSLVKSLAGGLFLGLAVLTKGPAAIVIAGITVVVSALWLRRPKLLVAKPFLVFAATTLIVAGSWFLVEILRGNGEIFREFIGYQVRLFRTGDAGHEGPFIYHFVVLLAGCFPASLLFIAAYRTRSEYSPYQLLVRRILLILFWTVLILFSIVKTKIVHYSSLCYFPLTMIPAMAIAHGKWPRLTGSTGIFFWIVAGVFFMALSLLLTFPFLKDRIIAMDIIRDQFAVMNLQADVTWTGWEWLLSLLFAAGILLTFLSVKRGSHRFFYGALFVNLAFLWSTIAVIIPKVELYSQHAAVAFYKASATQHCYIETHGFKSYAYLFYSQRKPGDFDNPDQVRYVTEQLDHLERQGYSRHSVFALANMNWMENGNIDRPAYIVIKTPAEKDLLAHPNMKKLYDLNGFSFFVRLPDK